MDIYDLEKFNYALPKDRIRSVGVEPRDSAKLFVYDTASNTVTHDIFRNIGKYLPKNTTLIFNETKVLPARLILSKETGGKVEIFILINEWGRNAAYIPALANQRLKKGQKLFYNKQLLFAVVGQQEERFFLSLENTTQPLSEILLQYGQTPIPPYLKANTQTEEELRARYQAVFAKTGSSVAAPTASLHFTDTLLRQLEVSGIKKETLSLEVGLGTFAPLTQKNFETNTLHEEYVTYTKDFLHAVKNTEEECFIPIGTTSMRALETMALKNIIEPGTYKTNIFITPGFGFQKSCGLLTNFHTPKSSLMILVESFLQYKKAKRSLISLYQEAMEHEYAFYSFGDSMLIL